MKKRQRSNTAEARDIQHKLIYECPAPYLSAQSWVILDRTKPIMPVFKTSGKQAKPPPSQYQIANNTLLFGRCETQKRQVASLTKIMTTMCTFNLMDKYPD